MMYLLKCDPPADSQFVVGVALLLHVPPGGLGVEDDGLAGNGLLARPQREAEIERLGANKLKSFSGPFFICSTLIIDAQSHDFQFVLFLNGCLVVELWVVVHLRSKKLWQPLLGDIRIDSLNVQRENVLV